MAKITSVSPLMPGPFPAIPPVKGVRLATAAAGIRYQGRPDLLLAEFVDYTAVAGVFTTSTTAGHPVLWCRRILDEGTARALVVNAGNANVFRGEEGDRAVAAEAEAVAQTLGCRPEEVYVASTGVIGERLPVERIEAALPALAGSLREGGFEAAARAIMTTDTYPKGAHRVVEIDGVPVTVAGIAKGSGMIAPDMATLLAFVFTDAHIIPQVLQPLLAEDCEATFNAITVDGDTSTSDTLLLFATQQADHSPIIDLDDPRLRAFQEALFEVLQELALMVVRDGEGARKLISVWVEGAHDPESARAIARSIANSPLVKTAIAGGDANWGRVVMAIGKSGMPIEIARLGIAFGGTQVARDGGAVPDFDEAAVSEHLRGQEIDLRVTVGDGPGEATVWTCDLTHGYIDINADYRS